jgi:hypothetical protein
MTTRPARFVSATCPCGVTFDREVKRGRPQIWCATCLNIPFYERNRTVEAVVTDETGEVVPVDPEEAARAARARVEAAVAAVYEDHRAKFAALADHYSPEATVIQNETAEALRKVYGIGV